MNVRQRINGLRLAALVLAIVGCAEASKRQLHLDAGNSADTSEAFPSLNSALVAGDVQLTNIRGNGNSSGVAISAILLNTTNVTLRLSTRLMPPLYLEAAMESSQNMLATQIYRDGGKYLIVEQQPLIEIPPRAMVPVVFNAYCVDFGKDNPTIDDSFALAEMPLSLAQIATGISAYEQWAGANGNVIARAQAALWLAQGEDPNGIRSRFDVSDADLAAAHNLDLGHR